MRSLFVKRLCMRKQLALRHFSGSPLCHIIGAEPCGTSSRDGAIGKLVISDYTDPDYGKTVVNKKVPMDLVKEMGTIGASHGWVATLKEGIVCLQDDLNPGASDKNPKRISLPPLETLPHCQTQVVTNIAMSSASPEDDDCIVAVKFLGPQLSLCSPQEDDEWVNISITDPGLFSSQVMYSKRDNMFSMSAAGGTYIESWNFDEFNSQNLSFPFYEEFVQSEWARLSLCCKSEHLVESPTGQTLMVKWYTRFNESTCRMLTERFLVFNIDENTATVTKDIGDLCIFLSPKGEPFCLKASLYGLSPNCIYYVRSHEFGKFSIRDNQRVGGNHISSTPYFIPPQH